MAWGWYIPLVLLALALLILLQRGKVGMAYEGGSFRLWVGLGPIRLTILPVKKRKPTGKTKKRPPKQPKKAAAPPAKQKRSLTSEELLDYARFGLRSVGGTARVLRIDELMVHAVIGGEDAAATAVGYGAASAALSGIYSALSARVRVVKHDLSLDAAFGGACRVEARVQISGMLLCLSVAGLKVLFDFIRLQRQHTGKAVTP